MKIKIDKEFEKIIPTLTDEEFFKTIHNHFACNYCIHKYKFNDDHECKGCKYNQELELRTNLNKFKRSVIKCHF